MKVKTHNVKEIIRFGVETLIGAAIAVGAIKVVEGIKTKNFNRSLSDALGEVNKWFSPQTEEE